jgi:hypothetical protein
MKEEKYRFEDARRIAIDVHHYGALGWFSHSKGRGEGRQDQKRQGGELHCRSLRVYGDYSEPTEVLGAPLSIQRYPIFLHAPPWSTEPARKEI